MLDSIEIQIGNCFTKVHASVCVCVQIILVIGGIPIVWDFAGSIIGRYGYTQDYEVPI